MVVEKKKKNIIQKKFSGFGIKFIKALSFLFVAGLFFFFGAGSVEAATMYFSPSSGSYKIGQSFSVSVYVSSADQAANAYLGTISFPTDKLQASPINKSGSVINLWVQEPALSNGGGVINFEGITLNPGYTGSSGKIITISFKVLASGTAKINFTSGSVLANDGQGTNILSGLGGASFNLSAMDEKAPRPTPVEEKVAEDSGLSTAPVVTSPNLSDSTKWYKDNNPEFNWPLPKGITGIGLLVDKNPVSIPTDVSDGLFSLYTEQDVEDGISYFHLRLRNNKGWGSTRHFRFQIDTQPPEELAVTFVDGNESESPRPRIQIKAVDITSGIDYYKIKIDHNDSFILPVKELEDDIYTLPTQSSGQHTLNIEVFDFAGNSTSTSEEFSIKRLVAPEITEYPDELNAGDILILKGKTYPDIQVTVWLQRDGLDIRNQTVTSDKDGDFTLIADDRVDAGIYTIWAEIIDDQMRRSNPSKPITLAVHQSLFWRITSKLLSYLVVLVPILALILLFLILSHRVVKKMVDLKTSLRKDIYSIEHDLHEDFYKLREDVGREVSKLEKAGSDRNLTREEEYIIKQLKEKLVVAEKNVTQKIEGFEEKIK